MTRNLNTAAYYQSSDVKGSSRNQTLSILMSRHFYVLCWLGLEFSCVIMSLSLRRNIKILTQIRLLGSFCLVPELYKTNKHLLG